MEKIKEFSSPARNINISVCTYTSHWLKGGDFKAKFTKFRKLETVARCQEVCTS
jgi:hypothetical protein